MTSFVSANYNAVLDQTSGPNAKGLPPLGTVANSCVILGDSLTQQNSVVNSYGEFVLANNGAFNWINFFLSQRLIVLNNAGVFGQRTDQIYARMDTDVLAYSPGYCIVLAGTNDVLQGIDFNTIISWLTAIYNKARLAGTHVIAFTLPPILNTFSTYSAAKRIVHNQVNNWIRNKVATTPCMTLVDLYPYLVDPTTNLGDPAPGVSHDGVHFAPKGAQMAGEAAFPILDPIIPKLPYGAVSNADADNLLVNAMLNGSGGTLFGAIPTGVVADNWTLRRLSGAINIVGSKVASTDGLPGAWQQLDVSGSTAVGDNAGCYQQVTSGLVIGGAYVFDVEVDVSSANNTNFDCYGQLQGTNGSPYDTIGMSSSNVAYTRKSTNIRGVITTNPLVLRSGNTALTSYIVISTQPGGSGTLKFRKPRIRRVG